LQHISVHWSRAETAPPAVTISRYGSRAPRWPELRFQDAAGQPLSVSAALITDGTLPARRIGVCQRIRIDAGK
jgi:hypothetical protein